MTNTLPAGIIRVTINLNRHTTMTTLPSLIRLPRSWPPEKVMSDPNSLLTRVIDYFSLLGPDNHPTPPGLAMAMGFASFDRMLQTLRLEDTSPGTYDPAAVAVLDQARTYLEDYYVNNGLREAIPQAFTRFLLSAYHNRSEKTIQEMAGGQDNNLQISIMGIDQANPVPHKTLEMAPPRDDHAPTQATLPTSPIIELWGQRTPNADTPHTTQRELTFDDL